MSKAINAHSTESITMRYSEWQTYINISHVSKLIQPIIIWYRNLMRLWFFVFSLDLLYVFTTTIYNCFRKLIDCVDCLHFFRILIYWLNTLRQFLKNFALLLRHVNACVGVSVSICPRIISETIGWCI